MRPILAPALALAFLLPLPSTAQIIPGMGDPELVDRVLAIAGDSVVLMSQLEEEVLRIEATGAPMPSDPAGILALRAELLEALVNQQLIVQAALRDTTIVVAEEELEELAARQLEQQIRRLGTQTALQQVLAQQGLSVNSYRELIKSQARRERLQQLYLERQRQTVGTILVDEAEVEAHFRERQGELPPRPATISFYQLVIQPQPSDSAREAARLQAEELLEQIRAGEDFETLARRFSQDPGSAQQGGDLGWFRRGVMVEAFEDTAFRMREGQVSPVVETPFGAHVIKLERVRGGERRARHILIRAEVSEEDVLRGRTLGDELAARIRAGESITDLRAVHGFAGTGALPDSLTIPVDQLDQLPVGYGALASATPGEIVGPIEFSLQGQVHLAVVRMDGRREEGPLELEDVRDQLRAQLTQQKVLDRILERLRERTYVEIRI